MDKVIGVVIGWGMTLLILGVVWIFVDAVIEFNKLDLVKIIGG